MEVKKLVVNGKEYMFVNDSVSTRNGFAHTSELFCNDCSKGSNRVNYLNRTWESYRYQTCMKGLVSNLINAKADRLKALYKAEMGITRMTKSHNEKLAILLKHDPVIANYKALYEAL